MERSTWVTGNLVWGDVAVRTYGGLVVLDNNLLVGGLHGLWVGEASVAQTSSIRHNSILSSGAAMNVEGLMTSVEMGRNEAEGRLPSEPGWTDLGGNVACEPPEDCWLAAATTAVSPHEGGLSIGAGIYFDDPSVDWCGESRGEMPSAGALERGSGAAGFEPAFKSQLSCAAQDRSSGSRSTPEEEETSVVEAHSDTGEGLPHVVIVKLLKVISLKEPLFRHAFGFCGGGCLLVVDVVPLDSERASPEDRGVNRPSHHAPISIQQPFGMGLHHIQCHLGPFGCQWREKCGR